MHTGIDLPNAGCLPDPTDHCAWGCSRRQGVQGGRCQEWHAGETINSLRGHHVFSDGFSTLDTPKSKCLKKTFFGEDKALLAVRIFQKRTSYTCGRKILEVQDYVWLCHMGLFAWYVTKGLVIQGHGWRFKQFQASHTDDSGDSMIWVVLFISLLCCLS